MFFPSSLLNLISTTVVPSLGTGWRVQPFTNGFGRISSTGRIWKPPRQVLLPISKVEKCVNSLQCLNILRSRSGLSWKRGLSRQQQHVEFDWTNDSDGPGALELFSPFWLLSSMVHRYSPISETNSGFQYHTRTTWESTPLHCLQGVFFRLIVDEEDWRTICAEAIGITNGSLNGTCLNVGRCHWRWAGKWKEKPAIGYCSGVYSGPRLLSNYVQLYDSSKTLEYRQDFQSQDV